MSNQLTNGFQGSQPFITDKQFQNMSLDEIRHIIAQEKEELKKDYKELGERKRLIKKYKKLIAARQEVKQGINIKKKLKKPKPPAVLAGPSKKKKMSILRNVLKIERFPKILLLIYVKLLKELCMNMTKDLKKKNQLLKTLLLSILFKEFLVLLQFSFLSESIKL